ncbi:uncharacterized protein LOC123258854 [Cotesia glomerata]|nr:uncharacterized protein LOC123258854 [Cotesia glomerata]XP_044575036.1 uncharacterized protein LOC123258854 [Cotesia glomerata]
MGITIRIIERNGKFIVSVSGKIEKTEKIYREYEDFLGSTSPRNCEFEGQVRHDKACQNLSTVLAIWRSRPSFKHKILSISDINLAVRRNTVTIKFQVFENNDYFNNKHCNVGLEKQVLNSVSSLWSNAKPYFDGEIIDYEIETENSSSFYYSQPWGKSTDRSKLRVLKDPSYSLYYPIVTIKPRRTLNVELDAIKTTLNIKITYKCYYDGDISYSYETIQAEFYSNPEIKF